MVKFMLKRQIQVSGPKVLGLTFRENCPDLRNTCVVDAVAELHNFGAPVDVHDPWADAAGVLREHDTNLIAMLESAVYNGIVLAVAHEGFCAPGSKKIRDFGKPGHIIFDPKSFFNQDQSGLRR